MIRDLITTVAGTVLACAAALCVGGYAIWWVWMRDKEEPPGQFGMWLRWAKEKAARRGKTRRGGGR